MVEQNIPTLTGACSLQDTVINCEIDPGGVVNIFQKELAERLSKKGIGLSWPTVDQACNLQIYFIQISHGKRALNYLISPPIVKIEGTVSLGGTPQQFRFNRIGNAPRIGGNDWQELSSAARGLARDLAKHVLKSIKGQQQQPYPLAPAQAPQIERGAAYPQTFQQPAYPEQVPAAVPGQIVEQAAVGQEEAPQQTANCPSCGISSPAGKAFCPWCGTAMKQA